MKKNIPKKAQLYGLSIFIYSIAIALVLIIGVVGLSREISVHSHAGLQRYQALSVVKSAETMRTFLDQERAYAVDRALYYTGAYGGYSQSEILDADTLNVNIPHIGEKEVPLWITSSGSNVPSLDNVINVFESYAGDYFSVMRPDMHLALRLSGDTGGGTEYYYNLYLDENFKERLESGIVETRWIPVQSEIFRMALPRDNPEIIYETEIYSHLSQETKFYELYEESKKFVEDDEEIFGDFLDGVINTDNCDNIIGCCEIEFYRENGELDYSIGPIYIINCGECAEDIIDYFNNQVHELEDKDNIAIKFTPISFTVKSPGC